MPAGTPTPVPVLGVPRGDTVTASMTSNTDTDALAYVPDPVVVVTVPRGVLDAPEYVSLFTTNGDGTERADGDTVTMLAGTSTC